MSTNELTISKSKISEKSKNNTFEIIRLLLPILGLFILEINYFFTPNYLGQQTTTIYPTISGIFGALYLILLIFFRDKQIYKNKISIKTILYEKAPLYFVVSLLFIFWDTITLKTGILPLPYFPWMDRIINSAITDRAILAASVSASLKLLGTGYIAGALIGFITGVLAGWNEKWNYWITPLTKLIGPIPVTTWIPIVMLLAPSNFSGSVFLIALGVWFPVSITTSSGVSSVRRAFFEVAKTLGADEKFLIFNVAIPAALPNVFIGLFQGMGVACATLIVAEMMGVKAGLGWYITWSIGWAEYSKVFASILIICITFTAVNSLLNVVKNKVLSWQKGVVK
ncbi:MAG: ABC transporter permease subunit [Bacillota bacterium]|nr:ABC transporter permease subunit [Bacillota bacterium]